MRPRSPHWQTPVLAVSARHGTGIPEFWEAVLAHRRALEASGELTARRRQQARAWLWNLVEDGLREHLRSHPAVAGRIPLLEKEVEALRMTPAAAAREILAVLRGG